MYVFSVEYMYIYMKYILMNSTEKKYIYIQYIYVYMFIYIDITYLYNACKKQINDIINPSLTVILCTYIDIDPARQ